MHVVSLARFGCDSEGVECDLLCVHACGIGSLDALAIG